MFLLWAVGIYCTAYYISLPAWQGIYGIITLFFLKKVYYHLGRSDRNGTNLAQICAYFAVHIYLYHSGLSRLFQELAWSNRIPNPKCMCRDWDLFPSDPFVVLFSYLRDWSEINPHFFLPHQLWITRLHDTDIYFF